MNTTPALIVPAPPPPLVVPDLGTDIGGYVDKYIRLRDKIDEVKKRHEQELAPLKAMKDLLDNGFTKYLQETNSSNASKTGVGTVYLKTRRSASIADGDQFRRFVIGGEHWSLVDWRANAPAVAEFTEANNGLPPGLNYSEAVTVSVRKS